MLHDPQSFARVAPFDIFNVEPLQNNLGGTRAATFDEMRAYLTGLALRAGLPEFAEFELAGTGGYHKRAHDAPKGGTFGRVKGTATFAPGAYSVAMPQHRREIVTLEELDEAGHVVRVQSLPTDPKKGGIVWSRDHVRKVAGPVQKPATRSRKAPAAVEPVRRSCACVEPSGKREPMSPAELVRHVRVTIMEMTQPEFADFLRMGSNGLRTVRRWENGETEPLGPVLMLLEAIRDGWRPAA